MDINRLNNLEIKSKYVLIGTANIVSWTDANPFIIGLNTLDDFIRAGAGMYYEECKDMRIDEVKNVYDGVFVIRINP